jgi:hypothetical protein
MATKRRDRSQIATASVPANAGSGLASDLEGIWRYASSLIAGANHIGVRKNDAFTSRFAERSAAF